MISICLIVAQISALHLCELEPSQPQQPTVFQKGNPIFQECQGVHSPILGRCLAAPRRQGSFPLRGLTPPQHPPGCQTFSSGGSPPVVSL